MGRSRCSSRLWGPSREIGWETASFTTCPAFLLIWRRWTRLCSAGTYRPPLFGEFGRNQWEYTNYARQAPQALYQPLVRGGTLLRSLRTPHYARLAGCTTGARQKPLIAESSSIRKGGQYNNWFSRLVISGDSKGQYRYSVMVGDEIWTTLTPMTFRKAGFNGVVADFAADRFRATGLFSRISFPLLSGGHRALPVRYQPHRGPSRSRLDRFFYAGDELRQQPQQHGSNESFQGNVFKGALTGGATGSAS